MDKTKILEELKRANFYKVLTAESQQKLLEHFDEFPEEQLLKIAALITQEKVIAKIL